MLVVMVRAQHVMAAALQRLVDNGAALRASVDLTGASPHCCSVESLIGRTCHHVHRDLSNLDGALEVLRR